MDRNRDYDTELYTAGRTQYHAYEHNEVISRLMEIRIPDEMPLGFTTTPWPYNTGKERRVSVLRVMD